VFLPDHTDTGGVGLTDALELLDDPAPWNGFTNAAGGTAPGSVDSVPVGLRPALAEGDPRGNERSVGGGGQPDLDVS
jgi:hypothetical protein